MERMAADPRPFVRHDKEGIQAIELLIRGARCQGCLGKIERSVLAIEGVTSARLNLSTGRLSAEWKTGRTDPRKIVQTIIDLGYAAQPYDPADAATEVDREGRKLLVALSVAGIASMNVMMFSVPIWSANYNGEMEIGTRTMFHWLSAAIALPAGAWAGMPFFTSAWRALRKGRANMDVPISLALLLAAGLSLYETAMGGLHAYFDAIVMLLFFLLIGRYLDHRLRQRARRAAKDLLALQTVTAVRLGLNGDSESVAVRDVRPGDRLMVYPGDRVPVDGIIEDGASDADLSLLTGETKPVALGVGQAVRAGALNLTGTLVLGATARSDDSFLAEIGRLIEAGEQSRSVYVRLADKAAELYVPLVHGAALLTAVVWLFLGADPRTAIMNACAVLIITCPCALGLAVPAVQIVATGQLFRRGILVKSGDALERLATVNHVAFDKTGVITLGQPKLINGAEIAADDLAAAALLARASRHPLARALARVAGPGPAIKGAQEIAGCGVEADWEGARARLGRAAWCGAPEAASEETELWFTRQGHAPLRFAFEDSVRVDARATVNALTSMKISQEILSGDREEAVRRAAKEAGIAAFRAELHPADKAAALALLGTQGAKTLMVGDGLNDAPALATAYVSMAPGAAADASQSAADLVFQGDKLDSVRASIEMARLAKARIIENFAFSALYNLIAAPLAMLGFVTPFIAAIAMSSSSIVVTLNALRLVRALPDDPKGDPTWMV